VHPAIYEVKKVYDNIDFKLTNIEVGTIEVKNKYFFKDLSQVEYQWSLLKDGIAVKEGSLRPVSIAPQSSQKVTADYMSSVDSQGEYMLIIRARSTSEDGLVPKGHESS